MQAVILAFLDLYVLARPLLDFPSIIFSSKNVYPSSFGSLGSGYVSYHSTAHLAETNCPTATTVLAQNVTYCPGAGVCFAVNVPAATAKSGSGDIYFQISGPSTMSWIGLGQGSQMKASNIFMIYANAAGTNVTLSPRLGTGNSQPSADTTAEVTLLSGSGISNNMMIANVRCMAENSFRKC
jgi:Cytochrome domain of cellobiose dehydrogenase